MARKGSRRVEVDGIIFDSPQEADRWLELSALQDEGVITDLSAHPRWGLIVNDIRLGRYSSDFLYYCEGNLIVEDNKTRPPQRDFRWQKGLMLALHGITVWVTGPGGEPKRKKK